MVLALNREEQVYHTERRPTESGNCKDVGKSSRKRCSVAEWHQTKGVQWAEPLLKTREQPLGHCNWRFTLTYIIVHTISKGTAQRLEWWLWQTFLTVMQRSSFNVPCGKRKVTPETACRQLTLLTSHVLERLALVRLWTGDLQTWICNTGLQRKFSEALTKIFVKNSIFKDIF